MYQEVLGSDHNMIGSLHAIRLRTGPRTGSPAQGKRPSGEPRPAGQPLSGDGWVVEGIVLGETIEQVCFTIFIGIFIGIFTAIS